MNLPTIQLRSKQGNQLLAFRIHNEMGKMVACQSGYFLCRIYAQRWDLLGPNSQYYVSLPTHGDMYHTM